MAEGDGARPSARPVESAVHRGRRRGIRRGARGGGTAAAAAEPPASDTQVFSVPPELKPEPRAATPLDFSLDDDISLAPSSGEEPKTPAAILAGAAQEVAKSSRAAATR